MGLINHMSKQVLVKQRRPRVENVLHSQSLSPGAPRRAHTCTQETMLPHAGALDRSLKT